MVVWENPSYIVLPIFVAAIVVWNIPYPKAKLKIKPAMSAR